MARDFGMRFEKRLSCSDLLYAVQLFTNDGPWEIPENRRKYNGVLRYSREIATTASR